jgi:Flp pilus assembly pilin Flp
MHLENYAKDKKDFRLEVFFCAYEDIPSRLLCLDNPQIVIHPIKEKRMFEEVKKFLGDESGQDFGEYALIFGAIGVIAMAVIPQFREAVINAFQTGIDALNMASGA